MKCESEGLHACLGVLFVVCGCDVDFTSSDSVVDSSDLPDSGSFTMSKAHKRRVSIFLLK